MSKRKHVSVWINIQKGDRVAFENMYRDHVDSLYNYGASLTKDIQLIEDSIQDIFINIWQRKLSININSNIKAYLFTSLRRQIFSQTKNRNKLELDADFSRIPHQEPSTSMHTDKRLEQINSEISKLPEREKEAIVLKYQEGMSYDEMSTLMSLKNHAIYKLVSRGLKKVRSNISTIL